MAEKKIYKERKKNVYKVTAGTEQGRFLTWEVFSHSPENAIHKVKVYCQRRHIRILDKLKVEQILKDVIY